ncbi:alkaline phosphatase D family protein [Marinicella rhabdoformis]|uniref:alkaline phosphatase D family protein n=1 Tax=Marinicella rhabdoformis TaxID=2580566 RepID=UPI0012AEB83E|nr:alkaline phosphatase D family protein [Marinicella rhabdoformis]
MRTLILFILLSAPHVDANTIKSGPMLGHTTLRAANIWVQAKDKGEVKLHYWEKNQPKNITKLSALLNSELGNIHTFKLSNLYPATEYQYQVFFGKKPKKAKTFSFTTQKLWQWREDPPEFSVLTGSCNFENEADFDRAGKPYGDGWEIFYRMAEEDADMMLWLGDNWYYREVDYTAEQSLLHRVMRDRSWPHLQPLMHSMPNYAIWDDHDYGPDNAASDFIFKEKSLELFKNYWANPSYGMPEAEGIFSKVQFNDVDFFLMDGRYHRSHEKFPDGPEKIMYGKAQLTWLKNQLIASKAPFKFIVGGNQMLNDHHPWEGWDKYRHERDAFLQWLDDNKIPGIIFLSGDKHHSELLKVYRGGNYPLHELTCSPFTAGTHEHALENDLKNPSLVKGTLVGTKNYCKLDFKGPRKDRRLEIQVIGPEGQVHWTKTINSSLLTSKE